MKVQVAFAALIFTALVATQTKAWEFENWPKYGKDPSHSFSNPLTQINARNVASLTPAWTFPAGDAVTASPAVVDGVVYVGSWDGFFYAIDAGTGQLRWKVQVDCQPSVVPLPQVCGGPAAGTSTPSRFQTPGGIITASAAVLDNRVYFGGGRTLYSLSASDGQIIWKHVICGNPEDTELRVGSERPVANSLFSGCVRRQDLRGCLNRRRELWHSVSGRFSCLRCENRRATVAVRGRCRPPKRREQRVRQRVVFTGARPRSPDGLLWHGRLRRTAAAPVSRRSCCARC